MVTLNLDIPLLDRPSAAAASLELAGQNLQIIDVEGYARNDRDGLSPPSLRLPSYPNDSVPGSCLFLL